MNDRFYEVFEKVMYVVVAVLIISFVIVCVDQTIDNTKCIWSDGTRYENVKPLDEVVKEFESY